MTTLCIFEGCDRIGNGGHGGYCRKHAQRIWRHGDPAIVRPRASFSRSRSGRWAGERVTYSGMHLRVRKLRGPASAHACVTCGDTARHWAYDHSDPDERINEGQRNAGLPFSLDESRYQPMCHACHNRVDHGGSRS